MAFEIWVFWIWTIYTFPHISWYYCIFKRLLTDRNYIPPQTHIMPNNLIHSHCITWPWADYPDRWGTFVAPPSSSWAANGPHSTCTKATTTNSSSDLKKLFKQVKSFTKTFSSCLFMSSLTFFTKEDKSQKEKLFLIVINHCSVK